MTADVRIGGGRGRILMIAPQPFFRPRGTPFSVLHRMRSLVRLGYRIDLVTYPFGDSPAIDGVTYHRSVRPFWIRDVAVGPSVPKAVLDVPLFRLAARLAARNAYDLIHTHEEAGAFGGWLSRRCGVAHLYDMHSSLPEQFENFDRGNISAVTRLFRRLERYTLAHADAVLVICPSLRDHVLALGYTGPLEVVENVLDVDEPALTEADVAALRAQLGVQGRRVILYTGTLESYQGLDLLVGAAPAVLERAADACFVVVGGDAQKSAPIRRMTEALGVAAAFRFVPAVSPAEVFRYLRLADVLATCRIRGTNTPLKIYQYLRSNRPIVATSIASHTQVLDHMTAELVAPSAQAVAAGIVRVLTDPAHASALAGSAACLARERYSENVYMERLSGLLERVPGLVRPLAPV